jgi:hypothetical protein
MLQIKGTSRNVFSHPFAEPREEAYEEFSHSRNAKEESFAEIVRNKQQFVEKTRLYSV